MLSSLWEVIQLTLCSSLGKVYDDPPEFSIVRADSLSQVLKGNIEAAEGYVISLFVSIH